MEGVWGASEMQRADLEEALATGQFSGQGNLDARVPQTLSQPASHQHKRCFPAGLHACVTQFLTLHKRRTRSDGMILLLCTE